MSIVLHREQLEGGPTVVAIHRPGTTTATTCVDLAVGSRYEAPADNGLSHFLEHMLFQGCDGYPSPMAVNSAAERLGAAIDASTGRDHTRFEHWVAADRLGESTRLIGALMRSPKFASIETERAIILEEALDEFDEDGRRTDGDTLSRRALWPGLGLGQSIIGELPNIRRFDLDDLKRHHQRGYGARNMVISVVGPQSIDALMSHARAGFGDLPSGEKLSPSADLEDLGGPHIELLNDHRSQCDCRLVIRTPGRDHRLATALALTQLALDDGLASRMHRRLGEELGLAYEQWATWERYPDTGAFEMGAMVSPGKVRTFYEEALGLLRGLADAPPVGDELDRVRFRARWAIASAQESAEGLIGLHATSLLWADTVPSPAERLARCEAVTSREIGEAAAMLLDPRAMVVCCVGPTDKLTRRSIRAQFRRLAVAA